MSGDGHIITFGEALTGYHSAFRDCYRLVEAINHSKLTVTAGDNSNGYVARYALKVHNGESKIDNKDGYLFYKYASIPYPVGYVGSDTALSLLANYNWQGYYIYRYAFYNCTGLTSITIPDGVTRIGGGAFEGCTGLNAVYYGGTADEWSEIYVGDGNEELTSATLYYYSESEPTDEGHYWHYSESGRPMVW